MGAAGAKSSREPSDGGMRPTLDSDEISTLINCKSRISAREDDGEALIGGGGGELNRVHCDFKNRISLH